MVRAHVAALLCLAAFACPATALAQTATSPSGQDNGRLDTLARTLAEPVSCSGANVRDALSERIKKTGAAPADVGVALAIISASSDLCAPVRNAASSLIADETAQHAAAAEAAALAPVGPSPASLIADANLEAQIRAASMKFEGGPPPRNLTRGRISTP
jgi:hypothetical protein